MLACYEATLGPMVFHLPPSDYDLLVELHLLGFALGFSHTSVCLSHRMCLSHELCTLTLSMLGHTCQLQKRLGRTADASTSR